jgi:hypothetical protein
MLTQKAGTAKGKRNYPIDGSIGLDAAGFAFTTLLGREVYAPITHSQWAIFARNVLPVFHLVIIPLLNPTGGFEVLSSIPVAPPLYAPFLQ